MCSLLEKLPSSYAYRINISLSDELRERCDLSESQVYKMILAKQNDHYQKYRFRLRQTKSAIDMSPPKSRCHVIFNAKRAQLEKERQTRISKDNFILLKKLNAIMHRKRTKDEYQRLRWSESRCIRIH